MIRLNPGGDLPDLAHLYALHRDRDDAINEERSLTLRMKARLRRLASTYCDEHKPKCPRCVAQANEWFRGKGDPVMAAVALEMNAELAECREPLHRWKLRVEREMTAMAKQLPVWPWADSIHGFGAIGLAQIIAEAGDLNNYDGPAKLWKRFGLAVIGGGAQRRVSDKEAAIEHGFSPKRRAVMFVIGDSLIKKQNAYRELYLERKAYEQTKTPDLRPIQHHKRAQRYMEKRLLRDLWREWRDA